MRELLQDLVYGARKLRKSVGFTAVAVITLTLGLAVNTAIFSLVDSILLRPLPYHQPDELVRVWMKFTQVDPNRRFDVSDVELVDLRDQAHSFSGLAGWTLRPGNLNGLEQPQQVTVAGVTPSLFPVLGIEPALGRTFHPEEEQPGRSHVAVLSHAAWQNRFGADPQIVGRTIELNRESYTVVGVMPSGFHFPGRLEPWGPPELWVPEEIDRTNLPAERWGSQGRQLGIVARLRPGVTPAAAQAELDAIAQRFRERFPTAYPPESGWGLELAPMLESQVRGVRLSLLVLLGAGGLVLLITCANLASLQLTRALKRQQELALRSALGATGGRLVRQLLAESTLLALLGAIPALLLAYWGVRTLVALAPPGIPRLDEVVVVDTHVFLFTLAISIVAGILAGLLPAAQILRADLHGELKEGGDRSSGHLGQHRLREALVVGEVAVGLVVLIGAGLLLQSFVRLQHTDLGFNPSGLLTFRVSLSETRYPDGPRIVDFYRRLLTRVESLAKVDRADLVSHLPLGGTNSSHGISFDDRPLPPGEVAHEVDFRSVSPGYFATMGIPVLEGRAFRATDDARAAGVVIVGETLARRFWPNGSPLGHRLKLGPRSAPTPWLTVVGVVGHVLNQGPAADSQREQVYYPYFQDPRPTMSLVVRSGAEDPLSLVKSVRSEVRKIDPDQPVSLARTMDDWYSDSLSRPRFSLLLLAIFGGVGLVLVVLGTYGIVSASTTERTQEMGIRIAMGADRGEIVRLVLKRSLVLAGFGVGLGLLGAFATTRFLSSQLHGVSPTDPWIYLSVSLFLTAVVLAATFVPARRASRLDPTSALRWT